MEEFSETNLEDLIKECVGKKWFDKGSPTVICIGRFCTITPQTGLKAVANALSGKTRYSGGLFV